jgi:SAM-dependent methyltransferase
MADLSTGTYALYRVVRATFSGLASGASRTDWTDPFAVAREKWSEVPLGNDTREYSGRLLELPDAALLEHWEAARNRDTVGPGFGIRGWYHALYRDVVAGKRLLDIGCGLGLSSIPFAEYGAKVTFVDVVPDNIEVVRRLCQLKGIDAEYRVLDSIGDLDDLPDEFEVVTALGSLIHAPLRVTQAEVRRVLPHLASPCRWLHFAYPKSRWVRDLRPPFWAWGTMTDGQGTPWVEYHDRRKVLSLFRGARVELLFECEWHGGEFNWFDLTIRSG